MILPIVAFGSAVLREKCKYISIDHLDLDVLLSDMWETMYASNGVGLAAPQIGLSLRIFIAFIDYKTISSFWGYVLYDSLIVSHIQSYVKYPSYNILYNKKQPVH